MFIPTTKKHHNYCTSAKYYMKHPFYFTKRTFLHLKKIRKRLLKKKLVKSFVLVKILYTFVSFFAKIRDKYIRMNMIFAQKLLNQIKI